MINNKRFNSSQFTSNVISDEASLKIPCEIDTNKLIIDISNLNLFDALKFAVSYSTKHFIKNSKQKMEMVVNNDETKKLISILKLSNIKDIKVKETININRKKIYEIA